MMSFRSLLLGSAVFFATAAAGHAYEGVVASIKPVHSLVAGVMQGVGEPALIVKGAGSPHTYSLRPSQARDLERARVVFWVGEDLAPFLEKPIETLAAKATTVALLDAHGLTKLAFREGGAFEKHGHDDHDDHAAHGHEKAHADEHDHSAHGHEKAHSDAHGHAHDHDHAKDHDHAHAHDHAGAHAKEADHEDHHGHGAHDPHVWLDPLNAKAMVHEIEEALVAADPANADTYAANAKALEARLDALTAEMAGILEPVKERPFVVFHDAYQYLENRFGMRAVGSITVSPEVIPGAERVAEIKAKLGELDAACVFAEPQFEPKLVSVVTEGTRAKAGVIDPLGAALEDGPALYFQLMRDMATSIRACLSPGS